MSRVSLSRDPRQPVRPDGDADQQVAEDRRQPRRGGTPRRPRRRREQDRIELQSMRHVQGPAIAKLPRTGRGTWTPASALQRPQGAPVGAKRYTCPMNARAISHAGNAEHRRRRRRDALALARDVLATEAAAIDALAARLGDRRSSTARRARCSAAAAASSSSGIGKSGHVARKLAATLASTGTPAFFVHPAEASHGDLGMITADDVVRDAVELRRDRRARRC